MRAKNNLGLPPPGTSNLRAPLAPNAGDGTTRDMHLLLHRSRSDLVPEIDAALRALRDDGTYTDLYVSAFGYAP